MLALKTSSNPNLAYSVKQFADKVLLGRDRASRSEGTSGWEWGWYTLGGIPLRGLESPVWRFMMCSENGVFAEGSLEFLRSLENIFVVLFGIDSRKSIAFSDLIGGLS